MAEPPSARAAARGILAPVARNVLRVVAVAAAYYVIGRLGLLLAMPPGYAAAAWPASGLALAAVLLWGTRVAPAVWVGSFLVNFTAAYNGAAPLASMLVPGVIALGAAGQAVLGAWLIRRFVGYQNILEQDFDGLRMLLLGGPVACMLNATVAVSALGLGGQLPLDVRLIHLLTWWVGDSIGVLMLTPLVLVWAARPGGVGLRRQLFVTVPLVALFAAVVAIFVFVSQREQARIATGFDEAAGKIGQELQKDLQSSLRALISVEGYYASGEDIEQHEFEIFAGRLLSALPAVRGLSWSEAIPASERARFERAVRAGGAPRFEIHELGADGALQRADERALYAPIRYVMPRNGGLAASGYDMLSEPTWRSALERARDTGRVTATGQVLLAQDRNRPGLLAVMPVYSNGIQPHTLAARRRYLHGFATAIFRVDLLMEAAGQLAKREGLALALYDDEIPVRPQRLYALAVAGQGTDGGLRKEVRFQFADRPMRLVFELPAPELLARRSWAAWLVLAGGLLLTSLVGMLLLHGVGRAARATALVDERTRELRRLNGDLVEEIARRKRLESDGGRRTDELARSGAELQRQAEVNRQLLRGLRHAEGELRRTATQLSASNRELEQFAYVASHDLKAPLRSIGSFAQRLARGHGAQLTGEAGEFLKFIQDGIQHMHLLIDDLLQLSRVDVRRLEPEPVSMQAVLDRACRQLTGDITASRAQIHASPLPDVHADANMLVQLLQNLIANAVKFQRSGARPEVWVEAVPDGESWHFMVRDNGIGIETQHLEHIFVVFKRLHEQYPGTGIGLAVCKKVVNLHGGEIWAESTPGQGTTMHFTLPRKVEPVANAA